MIWAKKRFEVLKRDWFRCKYCWKNWKDVTLEVDHIVPKKEWWNDGMENLVCSCRECNIWKWSDVIEEPAKNLYKQKIKDEKNNAKSFFYDKWNSQFMWTISKETTILFSMYLNELFDEKRCMDSQRVFWENKILFKQWLEYCDKILSDVLHEESVNLSYLLEDCFEDDERTPKNDNDEDRFWWRLNYKLTNKLMNFDIKKYVIKKYSLFHNLLENE